MKNQKKMLKIMVSGAVMGSFAFALSLGGWVSNAYSASGKGKIAFCDFQRAAKESKTGKGMLDDLEKVLDKKSKALEDQKSKVERMKEDLNKKSAVMDEKLKKETEDKYFDSMRDYQRLREDVERDLKKSEMDYTQEIMQKLRKVVLELGVDEGYDAIFPKETSVYYSKELDITDLLIKKLDRSKE